MVARGSAVRGTSADVPPTNLEQGVRREMMGCSLEGGEDAERKQGGFTASLGCESCFSQFLQRGRVVAVGARPVWS